ncbi:unnamed protein product [Acanthoscelides obtectus]|uniref:Uncharacterized protein n=1 Tax=Acanthoscelides obtectus TaxID=200917 RepID=A0A9P0LAW6_ACAOB|nr:unnamed protein product [Acanthoscelides obtectus]CAK1629645.1 Insulin-degrading enzyme [Acanthoscelides obtectus]
MQIYKLGKLLINSSISNSIKTTIYLYSTVSIARKTDSKMAATAGAVLKRYDNIVKSEEDKRSYRGLELSNHMKVLLVSDPTTDKSAAAMDVGVGKKEKYCHLNSVFLTLYDI